MKAILTRYHGPTNSRGSRVSATAEGWGRVSVPYSGDLSGDDVHWVAALSLLRKSYKYLRGDERMASGTLPNGDVVFVFAASGSYIVTPNDVIDLLADIRHTVRS